MSKFPTGKNLPAKNRYKAKKKKVEKKFNNMEKSMKMSKEVSTGMKKLLQPVVPKMKATFKQVKRRKVKK